MQIQHFLSWILLALFNTPILMFLFTSRWRARLDEALQEKDIAGQGTGVTSYARVTAAFGSLIIASFFWILGDIILAYGMKSGGAAQVGELLRAVWPYFLAGSALFLPYAFNQLKTVFPWQAQAASALSAARNNQLPVSYGSDEVVRITVVNLSSQISDTELQTKLAAITRQVREHFAPEWKHSAVLTSAKVQLQGGKAPLGTVPDAVVYLGDKRTDPTTGAGEAKGYHDRSVAGAAFGFVYLDVCALYDQNWSVTLSHEILEILADPTAIMSVQDTREGDTSGISFALEVCDPVQADIYLIDGVQVCNFVNRSFYGAPGGSAKLNHCELPQDPFKPRPGGYVTYNTELGQQTDWGPNVTDAQKTARATLGDFRRNGRRSARAPKPALAVSLRRRGHPSNRTGRR